MSYLLSDIRSDVEAQLQDDGQFLTPEEVGLVIDQVIRNLNDDAPYIVVKDIPGDGTQDYTLPSEYVKQLSEIENVEVPADENPPVYAEEDGDWFVYENPTKSASEQLRLRFKVTTPSTSDTIRVRIKTTHTVNNSSSTLNPSQFNAAVYLSMYFCNMALANRFNQTLDPTIDADAVDYGAKSQNYLFVAKEYMNKYKAAVGLTKDIKAAVRVRNVKVRTSTGEDWMFPHELTKKIEA